MVVNARIHTVDDIIEFGNERIDSLRYEVIDLDFLGQFLVVETEEERYVNARELLAEGRAELLEETHNPVDEEK